VSLHFSEDDFSLSTEDGAVIYGSYARSKSNPSKNSVIIIAHGLGGHKDEYIHLTARNEFTRCGFDVARFSFYCAQPKARWLDETNLAIQALDLNTVIDHFKKTYSRVFVCGHSYGCTTLLWAKPDVTALSFWDPSFIPWEEFWPQSLRLLGSDHIPYIGWGIKEIVGPAMIEEARKMTSDIAYSLAQSIKPPSQVISAEFETRLKRQELFDALQVEKEHCFISGADHCFYQTDTALRMIEKTRLWFERF
jgi:pimeloyl-ACP methyl ester carboxylesterase